MSLTLYETKSIARGFIGLSDPFRPGGPATAVDAAGRTVSHPPRPAARGWRSGAGRRDRAAHADQGVPGHGADELVAARPGDREGGAAGLTALDGDLHRLVDALGEGEVVLRAAAVAHGQAHRATGDHGQARGLEAHRVLGGDGQLLDGVARRAGAALPGRD